jgi:hypothetical protein
MITATVCLPREHAVRVAEIERDSLLMRAQEGGKCQGLWLQAATIADEAVKALRSGVDGNEAVPYLYRIGVGWMRAARCRGWQTPSLGQLRPVPPDSAFDPQQLHEGIRVELEHTPNRQWAKAIAKHHLMEDPAYYIKLRQVHLDGARW